MSIRIKKSRDISYKDELLLSDKVLIWIFIPITVIYSLVFFVAYMEIYILIMIFELVTRHQRIKDRLNGRPRY